MARTSCYITAHFQKHRDFFLKRSGGFSKKVGTFLFLPSDGNNLIRLFHQNLLPLPIFFPKSLVIWWFLCNQYVFLSRPRRFGKHSLFQLFKLTMREERNFLKAWHWAIMRRIGWSIPFCISTWAPPNIWILLDWLMNWKANCAS